MSRPPAPDFLVIGAAKSGTTSLAHYLRQHPDVFVAREKESHYFLFDGVRPAFSGPGDDEFNRLIISDAERYRRCFASAPERSLRGEASVYYMYRPVSLERALEANPEMKLVAILRDPVERAFSAWAHMRRDGRESLESFSAALVAEQQRMEQGWSYGWHYYEVGRYADQLRGVLERVPHQQLHVLLYEDLVADSHTTLQRLFGFLGVHDVAIDSSVVMNASGKPRLRRLNRFLTQQSAIKEGLKRVLPYESGSVLAQRVRNWNLTAVSMLPAEQAALRARYDGDVSALATLLGRDLDPWRAREAQ